LLLEGIMDKYRQPPLEESPALTGPDYVALVIEWDDLTDIIGPLVDDGTTTAPPSAMSTADNGPGWNRVDEAGMESFPASDPPSWGSSHAATEAAPEDISDEVTSPFHAVAQMSSARRVVLGLAAIAALFSMIEGLRRIRRHA
jgi:hypothetical protein